jgi:RNA polymerase sigma-B factor
LSRDGTKTRQALVIELGRQPSEREIADALDISLEEWQSAKLASTNRNPLSLNAQISNGNHKQADLVMTLENTLVDSKAHILQLNQEDRIELQNAMAQLEDKTREIIESVFFLQQSRQEVAKKIGVSPVTVTRRIQKGVEELMQLLHQQPHILEKVC